MPADYTQCRVRKQSNKCESEKRLVKSQRSGVALTEYGARGALGGPCITAKHRLRPKNHFSLTGKRIDYFFSDRSWDYIKFARLHNSFAFTETRIDYFFRAGARTEPHIGDIFRFFLSTADRRLTADRSNQISVRVIATIGITRGRKTVSPSRNVISIPFWPHAHNRAPALLNCSSSGIPCDPAFLSRARHRATAWLNCSP